MSGSASTFRREFCTAPKRADVMPPQKRKSKIPKPRHQGSTKLQIIYKSENARRCFDFWVWSFPGIWNLGSGISDVRRVGAPGGGHNRQTVTRCLEFGGSASGYCRHYYLVISILCIGARPRLGVC